MKRLKKYYQKFVLVGLLFALFMSVVRAANAADFNIVCQTGGCSGLSGPIFNETGILPGDTSSKSISIKNDSDESINIELQSENNDSSGNAFLEKVQVDVDQDSVDTYNGNLADFLDSSYGLGDLNIGDQISVNLEIVFPTDSDNEFQNNVANFDIRFIMTGNESGESQVLGTQDSNTNNSTSDNQSDDNSEESEDSLLGQVLGLSDTSALYNTNTLLPLGITIMFIGFYFLLGSLPPSVDSKVQESYH